MILLFFIVVVVAAMPYRVQLELGSDFPSGVPSMTVMQRFAGLQLTSPLTVSLGVTSLMNRCNVSMSQVTALGPEGYLLVQPTLGLVCVLGNAGGSANAAINAPTDVNRGLLYGTYELLQMMRVNFFHPLEPTIWPGLVDAPNQTLFPIAHSAPHYAVRGFHYHTEHPLELCEFFQGVDAAAETWNSMVPEFELYVEWLVANRQNALEFVLLDWDGKPWDAQRQTRIRAITTAAQSWGIAIGADFAISDKQQHAWHMVTDDSKAHAEIRRAVDWIAASNFSFIATENGNSEFTHSLCGTMLDYMNYLTAYAGAAHGIPVFIKAHCSTGQSCPTHNDPRTQQPVNFNFLPMLANQSLGVMPHTVQFYRIDGDPAPTYGNENFTYMLDFMLYEAAKRPTIYHGESTYWVNFDINVPLHLPIYSDTRIWDIQRLRTAEQSGNAPVLGHIVFTSGWEWGYWFNDVIAARAAWEAHDASAPSSTLLAAFMQPIAAAMFDDSSDQTSFVQLTLDTVAAERDLLVFGAKPFDPRITGIGFVTGWDTWASLAQLVSSLGVPYVHAALTNAGKVTFQAVHQGTDEPKYAVFAPLLNAMSTQFASLAARYAKLLTRAHKNGLMLELTQAMQMTALRAAQVESLYKYVKFGNASDLSDAESALATAHGVVQQRMAHYRAPISRIAAWRENPTAYNYGYLWSVKSLQYWWRDLQIARDRQWLDESPCLDNIVDPVNVAIGEGVVDSLVTFLYKLFKYFPYSSIFDDCLHEPASEPHYQ
jgi:hypothetical protein